METTLATLRLFNAVPVEEGNVTAEAKGSTDTLERCVRNGFVLHPSVPQDESTLALIEKVVGISGEKANAAFHKSWAVVRDTPMEILVLQQVIHYITTYGFEAIGIYDSSTVYVPNEELNVPDIEGLSLTVVGAMTPFEILEGVCSLGSSGIALHQNTLDDIMTLVEFFKWDEDFVVSIKNRELKALLYDFYGIVPSDPTEFLRHLISKLTDESLVIKNRYLIEKIKLSSGKFLDELLKDAPPDFASIFFRYKPLLLAMKSISRNKNFFNRMRKDANKMHTPLGRDYLNSVTEFIKNGTLDFNRLHSELMSVNIFRKVRLAYALSYRLQGAESIVYRVRNGRGYAEAFEWDTSLDKVTKEVLDVVLWHTAADLGESNDLVGKMFYIPQNIHYTLPASEKQFVGNVPSGTWVSVTDDIIAGLHWTNISDEKYSSTQRVDIDLSLMSAQGKIGWDSAYRSVNKDILFSGDVVDAPEPKGATELFYVRKGIDRANLVMANYFNYDANCPVPCKILVGHGTPKNFDRNYVINPNNILAQLNIVITEKQSALGLIISRDDENRFYFVNSSVGSNISSGNDEQATHMRNYLVASTMNSLDLGTLLSDAGATVVDERPVEDESGYEPDYVDLSPENLDKTTIIDLLVGTK